MVSKDEILARVYIFILSNEWGCNNHHQNQEAGPAAENDQDRLLTDRELPHLKEILSEKSCNNGLNGE